MKQQFNSDFLKVIVRSYARLCLSVGLISLMVVQLHAHAQTVPVIKKTQLHVEKKIIPEYYLSQTETSKIDITLGKSTLLKLPAPIKRISVGSPSVADVMLINPQEVYVLGKIVGMTNFTLWTKDGNSTVIDVNVFMDIAALKH